MNGFIKIDRKMLEWEWYKNEHTKNVFLHCLLKAYWKDTKIEGKTIPRGSFVSSIGNIAKELALTPMEVRTAVKHLKSTSEITTEGTNRNTVFTVNNYNLYQSDEQTEQHTDNEQITNQQQSNNNPLTTNEEREEGKEREEKDLTSSEDDVCQTNVRRAVDAWNNLSGYGIPPISKMSSNSNRYLMLSARIGQYGIDDVLGAIEKIKQSDFLQGRNNRNWTITFDWFVRPNNFPKVLDGNYGNRAKAQKEPNELNDDDFCGYVQL